jgi:hypothetical protein
MVWTFSVILPYDHLSQTPEISMRPFTAAASLFGMLVAAAPAMSADLIEDYPGNARQHRTAYVSELKDCSILRIDYRAPYEARREFVNVCYPPLDLSPASSGGIRERYAPTRSSYVLR